jgi:hypothetical protein
MDTDQGRVLFSATGEIFGQKRFPGPIPLLAKLIQGAFLFTLFLP